MTQCCYKNHREDPQSFQKSMPYQHPNCCVGIRKECSTNTNATRVIYGRSNTAQHCRMFRSYNEADDTDRNGFIFALVFVQGGVN